MTDMQPKPTLLLVDDDYQYLEVFYEGLTQYGFEVTQASDGAAAIRFLQGGKFDFLVTDFIMPTVDGSEVISRAISMGYAFQKIILMSNLPYIYTKVAELKSKLGEIRLFAFNKVPNAVRLKDLLCEKNN